LQTVADGASPEAPHIFSISCDEMPRFCISAITSGEQAAFAAAPNASQNPMMQMVRAIITGPKPEIPVYNTPHALIVNEKGTGHGAGPLRFGSKRIFPFGDMLNCPGDICFCANSRHWMRRIYEYKHSMVGSGRYIRGLKPDRPIV
jgi:hypothetical protein